MDAVIEKVRKLVVRNRHGGARLSAAVETEANGDTLVVFKGGRDGEHSIVLTCRGLRGEVVEVSSWARIKAHWDGYCANNGAGPIGIGDRVVFPSGSSKDGTRIGRVVKVTKTRVEVSYRFKHGGVARPKWVKREDIAVWDRGSR
jgi:ribosomal protein L24